MSQNSRLAEMDRSGSEQEAHTACAQQLSELRIELDAGNAGKNQLNQLNQEHVEQTKSLQIELVAIQGLYKNATEDIVKLKSYNDKFKHQLDESKQLVAKYREDMDIIQAQVCNNN